MFSLFKTTPATPRLDPAQAVRAVGAGEALVIDVRERNEIAASGAAKGALILPLSELALTSDPASARFERKLKPALAGGKPVYVYCASGARSGRAADILRNHGFTQVQNLGGFRDWVAAGGAVAR